MTSSEPLHQQLTKAADQFPVRGWPASLQRRAARRRHVHTAMAVGAAAAAMTAVAAIPLAIGAQAPTAGGASSYVGSSWRLATLTKGPTTFTVPARTGPQEAKVDFLPDGRIFVNDTVNVVNGQFTTNAHGFEVRGAVSSAAGYIGENPRGLEVITALDTLAGDAPGQNALGQNTLVHVGTTQLVIQAGKYLLTFQRTGPATGTE